MKSRFRERNVLCGSCRFWQSNGTLSEEEGEQHGTCHRHAPRPTLSEEAGFVAWPLTMELDFCGDWEDGVNKPLVGVSEMDSEADRKSVATQGSAHSCGQPFDSAPATQAGPVPAADGTDWPTSGAGPALTDEERAAIMWFSHYGLPEGRAATLRSLLDRLK
jgi:hypothetical protein